MNQVIESMELPEGLKSKLDVDCVDSESMGDLRSMVIIKFIR